MRILTLISVAAVSLSLVPSATLGGQVDVEATKLMYEVGETVTFTITNNLSEVIRMNGFPPWRVIEDASGWHMSPCTGLPTIHPIGVGSSETYHWDQINCHTGEQVESGLFWAHVEYWTDSDPIPRIARAPFCVSDECTPPTSADGDVLPVPWGIVKSAYR